MRDELHLMYTKKEFGKKYFMLSVVGGPNKCTISRK